MKRTESELLLGVFAFVTATAASFIGRAAHADFSVSLILWQVMTVAWAIATWLHLAVRVDGAAATIRLMGLSSFLVGLIIGVVSAY